MSTLAVPWLVYPLVLAVLSLGCGLLVEAVSGFRLPGPLLLPSGFAAFSLIAQMATASASTAKLATPAVVTATVAGLGLGLGKRFRRVDRWAAGASIAVYAVYAAPIVLSGRATFAGYIKLDDDSTLLAVLDRAMQHGRSIAGVEPSTYYRVLDGLLIHGYPLATFMPLGVGRQLVGGDAIWLYQPCMAFMAAMLALSAYELVRQLVASPTLRALVAFVAAQSALLYGYALWGGIKEIGTAWALPLLAALVPGAVRATSVRRLIPLAVATALLLGVLSAGAGVWVAPTLAFTLVAIVRARGISGAVRPVVAFVAFLVVLALPTVVSVRDFIHSGIASYSPLANLLKPLSPLQMAGIWPTGDFRYDPPRETVIQAMIALALAVAAASVVWAVRRRDWALAIFVAGSFASALVLYGTSSPWIAGKAFATASPAVPLGALAVCAALTRARRPVEGIALAVVIAGGVVWTNVLQYRDAWLAPRSQLAELETIGNRFAGDGPALMTQYQPYGVRHLLRKLDAEGASELRIRQVELRTGETLGPGGYANIDDFAMEAILVYRTLVLGRSPVESRPPSPYRLVWKGRWYEVWQRPETSPVIGEHLPLGSDLQPAAVPGCPDVLRLAQLAGPAGTLATVERPSNPLVFDLSNAALPAGWLPGGSQDVVPSGSGTLETSLQIPVTGRYEVWLGGSFRDHLDLAIDGSPVGSDRNELNHAGQFTPFRTVDLAAGVHRFTLRYSGPDLHPGSGGAQFAMGPLILGTTTADLPVTFVRAADARTLCGKSLDWIEALGA